MSNQSKPLVSVVIPVFNDFERLKTCLKALGNQTYPKNCYEVIVVDNGSDENIESLNNYIDQVFITYESCPGAYAARNKGISLAKGQVIAFTDSDCIPAFDWIEKGVKNLLSVPNCGLVGGKIELFFKNPERPTAVELYESVLYNFPQEKFVKERNYGLTANLFTLKSVIDNVGYFDSKIKSGGDFEWGQRVFSANYKQVYAEDTYVAHPARHSLSQLLKRINRVVGGKEDLKRKNGYKVRNFVKDLIISLKPPFRIYLRIWSDKRLQGNKQKIQVASVMFLTQYLRIWESIRLQFGGRSTRG